MKGVVVVVVVVLSLFAGRSKGRPGWNNGQCLGQCLRDNGCREHIDPSHMDWHDVYCISKCTALCIFSDNNNAPTPYNFCNLGCAISLCTNFGLENNPDVIKDVIAATNVESCVDWCSGTYMNA